MAWTGNTNFAAAATFALEQSLTKDWNYLWTKGHPFYRAMAYKGTHFNKGFSVNGTSMIIPIVGAKLTDAVAAVTVANEVSALSLANNIASGFTQAQYYFAHYQGNVLIRDSDKKLAAGGQRGNFLEGMKGQILNDFKDILSEHIIDDSATAPTVASYVGDRIENLLHVIAVGNTVGGINQATSGNEPWRGQVQTTFGPFNTDAADYLIDAVNDLGRSSVDLILASTSSTSNVLAKFRATISPSERYENSDFTTKTGLNHFMFRGAPVIGDNRAPAGYLVALSTDSWYVHLPEKPDVMAAQRIPGTGVDEIYCSLWAGVGCGDPACNGVTSGIT